MVVVEIPRTDDVEPRAPRILLGAIGTVGTSENYRGQRVQLLRWLDRA